ncbi:hypothetical protein ACLOJK_001605 [Asimina triloba]
MSRGRNMSVRTGAMILFWAVYVFAELFRFSSGEGPVIEKQTPLRMNSRFGWPKIAFATERGDDWTCEGPTLLRMQAPFMLLLLLTSSLSELNLQTCSYTVLIETTCTKGGGTSDHISLRFGSSNSSDILVHHLNTKHQRSVDRDNTTVADDIPRRPFRPCTVDQFHVTGPCVRSQVCYLYLKHRGKDDWRPGVAQVLVPAAAGYSSQTFYFRRFLPRNVWHGSSSCDAEFTPFGIKHPRMVFDAEHKVVTKVLF